MTTDLRAAARRIIEENGFEAEFGVDVAKFTLESRFVDDMGVD
jgi:hypothetical protein